MTQSTFIKRNKLSDMKQFQFFDSKAPDPKVKIKWGSGFWNGFWTYDLICPLSTNSANVGQDSKLNNFFEISWFYWTHLTILHNMTSCLGKLELEFWTYGLILLLSTSFNFGWLSYLESKRVQTDMLFWKKSFIYWRSKRMISIV